ncbi:MAG: hypothetical protein JWO57_2113, partial [Pseudonocardiales bacterium]|nr:hypothetical protein [Pseudonocardiales bacterium]
MFDSGERVVARQALAELEHAIHTLQTLAVGRLGDDDVLDLIRDVESVKRRLATVDHAVINEVERRRLAAERGCTSTVTLLVQLLRLPPTEAGERVRAAAALGQRQALTGEVLPAIFQATAAASAAGSISARHAAIITHLIDRLPPAVQAELDTTVEAILLEHAHQLDPRTLAC